MIEIALVNIVQFQMVVQGVRKLPDQVKKMVEWVKAMKKVVLKHMVLSCLVFRLPVCMGLDI